MANSTAVEISAQERREMVDAFLETCVTDMWCSSENGISNLSHYDGDQAVRFRYGDLFVRINLVVGLVEDWEGDDILFESHRDLSQEEGP